MSTPTEKSITCPKCGARQVFLAWESVNVTLHPELKAQLLEGSLTRATCQQCGESAEVLYQILFHDPKKQLLIWLWQEPKDPETAALQLDRLMSQYRLRLVRSRNELVEKILIFDAELDDRVVELVKLLLRVQSSQGVHPLAGELLFVLPPEGNGEPALHFEHFDNGQIENLSVPMLVYERMAQSLDSELAKFDPGKWLRVDVEHVQSLAVRLQPKSAG